jgi:predicted carbohydrate-binding protein with CBM5 and CBM33 domain
MHSPPRLTGKSSRPVSPGRPSGPGDSRIPHCSEQYGQWVSVCAAAIRTSVGGPDYVGTAAGLSLGYGSLTAGPGWCETGVNAGGPAYVSTQVSSRRSPAALLVALLAVLVVPAFPGSASAHGAPTAPLSRSAECGAEGAFSNSPACRAAVQQSPDITEEWDDIRVAGVEGRDREVIPDGQLCSAGRLAFAGLDQPRADWPTTELTAGADLTFRYRGTIPHTGTFRLYVSKPGFTPDRPLTWADLETEPFAEATDPLLLDGTYSFDATLPQGLTGRHLIYTIWQNSSSADTYYSCSDVVFVAPAGVAAPAPAAPPTAEPTTEAAAPAPTSDPAPAVTTQVTPTAATGPGGVPMPAVLAGSAVVAGGVLVGAVLLGIRGRRRRAALAAGRHRRR